MKILTFAPDEEPLPRRQLRSDSLLIPLAAATPAPLRAVSIEKANAAQTLRTLDRIVPVMGLLNEATRQVLAAARELTARPPDFAPTIGDEWVDLVGLAGGICDLGDTLEEISKRLLRTADKTPGDRAGDSPAEAPEMLPFSPVQARPRAKHSRKAAPAAPVSGRRAVTPFRQCSLSTFLPRAKNHRPAAHCSRWARRQFRKP